MENQSANFRIVLVNVHGVLLIIFRLLLNFCHGISSDMHQGCPHKDRTLPRGSDHDDMTRLQETDLSVSFLTPPLHDY